MDEMKMAGAVAAAVCAAMLGFALGNDLKRRGKLLQELYKGIVMIHQEMDYMKAPLEEAMRHAQTILEEPLSSFFRETGTRLERLPGTPFFSVWEEMTQRYLEDSGLAKEDLELVAALGRQLGGTEALGAGNFLAVYEQRVSALAGKAEEEYVNKAQLYGRLGVLGGAFLVILLI